VWHYGIGQSGVGGVHWYLKKEVTPLLVGNNSHDTDGCVRSRYTDFLVNEILPSGVVVHLDNLKCPPRGKQGVHRFDAKPGSSATGGKDAEQQSNGSKDLRTAGSDGPLPSLPASSDENSSPHLVKPPKEQLPPHLRASLQAPSSKAELVEVVPLCRTRHKIILRETITGLVVVDPQDEVLMPDVSLSNDENDTVKPSPKLNGMAELGDTGVSEGPQKTTKDAVVEFGDGTDSETLKQHRQEPGTSSAADWQAYANVTRGHQVSIQLTNPLQAPIDLA
jgi:hypothetical protein